MPVWRGPFRTGPGGKFLARGTEVGSRAPGLGHDQTQRRHATGIISVNDERQVKLGRHGDVIDYVDALIHTHLCMFREFLCNRACYGHELWQVTVCRRVTSSNQVETSNGVSTGKPSNQRLMQYGSGSEHGQVYHECSRRNQAGRHGGVQYGGAIICFEAVAKDTTID